MFGSIKQNRSSDMYLKHDKKLIITDSDSNGENKVKFYYLNARQEAISLQEKGENKFSLDSNQDVNSEIVDSNIVNLNG